MKVVCGICHRTREVTKEPRHPDNRCRSCSSKEQVQVYQLAKFRVCRVCGDKKRVKTDKEASGTICRDCLNKDKNGFQRVCIDCGDSKYVDNERDSKALRCKVCSAKEVARKRIGTISKVPKKVYWYFCANCPKVQVKRTKQGGTYCQECNRKQPRKKNRLPITYFDLDKMEIIAPMRHIRICPHCPSDNNTKTVQVARLAGIRPCLKHAYIDNPEALAEKEAKRKATRKENRANGKHKSSYTVKARRVVKAKDKKVSKEAIEKQIQINREHRDAVAVKESIPKPKLTEEQMMAKFMLKSKVTVIPDVIRLEDLGVGMKTGFCRGD